ncbi:MAG: outer membrane protein assembly complex protein YaeT, partial [Sulfurimonas sp.]
WKKDPKVNPKTAILLAQTIKNYYRSRGFFHTLVTQSEKNGSIEISITEKSFIQVLDIKTLSKIDLDSTIPFKIGQIFDAQKFDQSKKDIKLLYANKGYCNTEIEAKAWIDIETNSAYLVYDITPNKLCYFDSIKISPPKDIDADIIKSLLYIKEEKPFSPYLIAQSYKSLYGHDGISKAIIDTQTQDANKSTVNVTVTQNEKPIRLQVGLGASSDEGMMYSLEVKHRNLFGNLKTLSASTRITDIKKTIKSDFSMPIKNRNSIGVEIGYEDESFTGFKEERVLGSITLKQREINYVSQEAILLDNTITYDSQDQDSYPEGQLFVLSPQFKFSYDTRDNILNPTKGYQLSLEVMGSILSEISDATYYKYNLSGTYILPVLPSVLALKMDFGALKVYNGDVPASYRFYAGGMNSNRAYTYRELGPTNDDGDPEGSNSILEMTLEYRFPIYGKFRGVLFNDNTFLGDTSYPDDYRGYSSAGFGLRYLTPIGPIAIDVGFAIDNPLDQYAIHFHIGELF